MKIGSTIGPCPFFLTGWMAVVSMSSDMGAVIEAPPEIGFPGQDRDLKMGTLHMPQCPVSSKRSQSGHLSFIKPLCDALRVAAPSDQRSPATRWGLTLVLIGAIFAGLGYILFAVLVYQEAHSPSYDSIWFTQFVAELSIGLGIIIGGVGFFIYARAKSRHQP
jgi:hypothetical protein